MKKIILSIIIIFSVLFFSLQIEYKFLDSDVEVVVTTNQLGEIVNNLLKGTGVKVSTLFNYGVDPHLYTLSFSDLNSINNSKLLIASGLHLEASMYEGLKNLEDSLDILFVGDLLPTSELIQVSNIEPKYDPHFWFDLDLLSNSVQIISEKLLDVFPDHKDLILSNTQNFNNELIILENEIDSIDKGDFKYLVTTHDAFSYLSRQMGFELKTLIGVNTNSDFTQFEMDNLKDFILEKDIRKIFSETTFDPKPLIRLQESLRLDGYEIQIVPGLLGDSMLLGQSFFDFYRHNLNLLYGK